MKLVVHQEAILRKDWPKSLWSSHVDGDARVDEGDVMNPLSFIRTVCPEGNSGCREYPLSMLAGRPRQDGDRHSSGAMTLLGCHLQPDELASRNWQVPESIYPHGLVGGSKGQIKTLQLSSPKG